jgi:hypothetical protein
MRRSGDQDIRISDERFLLIPWYPDNLIRDSICIDGEWSSIWISAPDARLAW